MDALESLQLSSFQGPHAVLVEPLISNAVWQRYGVDQAEKRRADGIATSIYSHWTAETACGLRHGSATRFSDLFDWEELIRWLKVARGIGGGVLWPAFLDLSQRSLDVVLMLSDHPGRRDDKVRVPCEDSIIPTSLVFF